VGGRSAFDAISQCDASTDSSPRLRRSPALDEHEVAKIDIGLPGGEQLFPDLGGRS
jgi:hypothetical protein